MIYTPTKIPGVYLVALEPVSDERGSFARTWCAEEFSRQGLENRLSQCSLSYNRHRGTLRGVHFQAAPYSEAKLIRATRGAVFDVAVDVRPSSTTFGQWVGFELSQDNRLALYIPNGCAHGMQTLVDHTEIFYQISAPYQPGAGRGLRWDDPALGITWPLPVSVMSKQDSRWPDLVEQFPNAIAKAA